MVVREGGYGSGNAGSEACLRGLELMVQNLGVGVYSS